VPAPITLSTAQLRRFLECPLQGSTSALLRLTEIDDGVDAAFRADEAFDPNPNKAVHFLREVFAQALRSGTHADDATLARLYDAVAERKVLDGTLPLGTFGAVARRRHLQLLIDWREGLRRVTGDALPAADRVFFGHAGEHEPSPRILPAVALDVSLGDRAARVSLHGPSELFAERDGERLTLLLPKDDRRDSGRDHREYLRAFIDHVMVAAAGSEPPRPTRALLCRSTGKHPQQAIFPALAPAEARTYLDAVVTDLFSGVHDYLLPFEAVLSWHGRDRPRPPVPDIVAMLKDDNWTKFQSDFGPVRNARDYLPPSDERARAMIDRRLGLFLDSAAGEEA
jgi:hypothetical protein